MPLTSNAQTLGRSPLLASDTNPLPCGLSPPPQKSDFLVYVTIEMSRIPNLGLSPGVHEAMQSSTLCGMKEPESTKEPKPQSSQ